MLQAHYCRHARVSHLPRHLPGHDTNNSLTCMLLDHHKRHIFTVPAASVSRCAMHNRRTRAARNGIHSPTYALSDAGFASPPVC